MALELFVNDNNNGIEMNVDSNIQDLSLGQSVVKEAIKELYKCIYGETTFDQITEAIASGKFPYLVNGSSTYWLVEDYADYIGEYDFEFTDTKGYVHFACCSGEGWRSGTVTPLFADQKVTELNDQSTDNEVPSAKCVYDALQTKQNTLTFDSTPTENSTNPVTSDGIYDAIMAKTDVVVYTGFCDYSVGSEVQPAGLNGGKTRADIIADIEANKIVIIRIEDLYMDVYDFVYAGKQNIFNEPPLSNEISYTFIYNKATDNKCVKLLVASYSNSIVIQKWMDAEDVENKVTSLSASNTNTQYPSAKCVYDALPKKTSDLTNDGADGTSQYAEVSQLKDNVVIYTSTNGLTYAGLVALLNANVMPVILQNGIYYYPQYDGGNNSSLFFYPLKKSGQFNYFRIRAWDNDKTWDSAYVLPERNAAIDYNSSSTPISSSSTDGTLPTSKAVYDALPKKTSDLTNDGSDGNSTYVEADDNHDIPVGGNAGQVLKKNSATNYDVHWANETEIYPSGYCTTAGGTATKVVNCSLWTATPNTYLHILIAQANTYADAITMKINASSPIPVYINGDPSSTTNYSLPGGSYIAFYDGTNIYLRTDGQLPGNIVGEAAGTEAKLATKADSAGASANYAAKLTARIPYGECNSTSTSTAFTATVPGITELKDGVCMLLYNGVVTSASGFTININGLGAKPSYNNMTMGNPVTPTTPTRDTTIFNINYAFLFVYSETLVSGGCWIGYRGYDANTNTIGYQLRTNNTTMKTADKFYRYRLLFTSADGTKWIPANTSTSTNATSARTPNTRAIDPFGEIVWYGTTTVIEANANVTAGQLWQEYYSSYTNIGYSFNNTGAAQTMTANQPIYIVCTPQADGSAVIDPTTPYTQTLPTTDDGKIYIYLGRAYNATNFELLMNHPVYYHDGTGIKIWCGGRLMPNPPSTDGTYTLQCTVSSGVTTYNWI